MVKRHSNHRLTNILWHKIRISAQANEGGAILIYDSYRTGGDIAHQGMDGVGEG
jgi:hypothetical protein